MKLAFIGTTFGLTQPQHAILQALIKQLKPVWILHTDQTGADAQFDWLVSKQVPACLRIACPAVGRISVRCWEVRPQGASFRPTRKLQEHREQMVADCDAVVVAPQECSMQDPIYQWWEYVRESGKRRHMVTPEGTLRGTKG